jgi:hypothetical protein
MLGGLFAGEGVVRLSVQPGKLAGWVMIVAGLVIPLALGRSGKEKLCGLLGALPAVGLAIAGYSLLGSLTG